MNCTTKEYAIGKFVKLYNICPGSDGSHWGLTDLYPEVEKNLRELLASDGDFETGWSSRKEPWDVAIRRIGKTIHISVSVFIDDIWEQTDLIDDALYDIGKSDVELSDEDIDYIRDLAFECEIDDYATAWQNIESSDYDEVMTAIDRLLETANETAERYYETLKTCVEDCINTKTDRKEV